MKSDYKDTERQRYACLWLHKLFHFEKYIDMSLFKGKFACIFSSSQIITLQQLIYKAHSGTLEKKVNLLIDQAANHTWKAKFFELPKDLSVSFVFLIATPASKSQDPFKKWNHFRRDFQMKCQLSDFLHHCDSKKKNWTSIVCKSTASTNMGVEERTF